jgi:D-alanyl-D-alanine dipeptidase
METSRRKAAELPHTPKASQSSSVSLLHPDCISDSIIRFIEASAGYGMKFRSLTAMLTILSAGVVLSDVPRPAQDHDMVDIRDLAPAIRLDIRYATENNFTGKRVTGYDAPKCLLRRPVASALAEVERDLRGRGYALLIYDCYRPRVSVAEFMRWAADTADQSTKAAYYPDLDKSALVPDYIAEKSGHTLGATADVGLLDCRGAACLAVDMGTPFDFFGLQANTAHPALTSEQKQGRQILLDAMAAQGFVNYPMEWWHFTWKAEVLPPAIYDFPIQ